MTCIACLGHRYASLARRVTNRPVAARSPAAVLRREAATLRAAAGEPSWTLTLT